MKIPRTIKSRLRKMRDPILEQMGIEQAFQAQLRLTMTTSEDEEEVEKSRVLFDESVKHWEVLKKALEEYDKLGKKDRKFSPDAILAVMGNLAGILLILNFEKMDIIRSKAISFVLKGKV